MRRQTSQGLGMLFVALLAWSGVASAENPWRPAPTPPRSFRAGSVALQLTDGTIMVQEDSTSKWWKLTPDQNADYDTGTWSELARSVGFGALDEIVDYAPSFFASAVLPDGRVIVIGGEYLAGVKVETNMGAIFDPTAGPKGSWTPVHPPTGWGRIGDAASVVLPYLFDAQGVLQATSGILPNGTFMLSNCCGFPPRAALLNEQAALLEETGELTWTVLTSTSGYEKKYDSNNEEGWTLLPDGNVLTVDAYIHAPTMTLKDGRVVPTRPNATEIYNPANGTWKFAGSTPKPLSDLPEICHPPQVGGHEVGPAILRPDGTVFATGVYFCKGEGPGAGHTAIYHTDTGLWTASPDIPGDNDMADAPAALLQDGNVLVQTSPGINHGPSTFYEFDFKTNEFSPEILAPPHFSGGSSEKGRMLVVASGHVFYMREGAPTDEMWFYVPKGTYDPAWAPLVEPVAGELCVGCVVKGHTYTISGTQFNGLSQGAAYGDDSQSATNYPLVRIENCATGHKFFARTHDFPTGVATGLFTVVTTEFDVSPSTETGPSNLVVIANGIPSQPAGGSGCVTTVLSGEVGTN